MAAAAIVAPPLAPAHPANGGESQQSEAALPPLDAAVYAKLLSYLPPALRAQVEPRVAIACEWFTGERHYEVLQALDEVRDMCEAAAAASQADSEGAPVTVPAAAGLAESASSDTERGRPTPTYLSVMLFSRCLSSSHMYVTATKRAADCNELLRDIEDTAGWRSVSVNEKGEGTFHRLDKPTGHHYFKVVSEIALNPIYLCGTIMELDLYPEWFPMCVFAQSQGDVSRFHKSSHFVIGVPWPFDNRDAFIEGYGIDDLERNRRLIIVAHSLYEDKGPLPRGIRAPQHAAKAVRCDVHYGGFLIQMLSPTLSRLSFVMSIDPRIPNLPQAALNWVSSRILWQMTVSIGRASARGMSPGSKYWQRRRQRVEVYQLFRQRYNELLRKAVSPEVFEQMQLKEDY